MWTARRCFIVVFLLLLLLFFYVLYSTQRQLLPFKLHCVGGCWDSNPGLLRLSNAQFYTVSVRTFVIPFYRGSGSGFDLEP